MPWRSVGLPAGAAAARTGQRPDTACCGAVPSRRPGLVDCQTWLVVPSRRPELGDGKTLAPTCLPSPCRAAAASQHRALLTRQAAQTNCPLVALLPFGRASILPPVSPLVWVQSAGQQCHCASSPKGLTHATLPCASADQRLS